MAKNPSSGPWRRFAKFQTLYFNNDRSILIARLVIIVNYVLVIRNFPIPDSIRPLISLSVPLFLLVYGLLVWFGSKFTGYRNINMILSCLEILLVSFCFYHSLDKMIIGGFLLYLVGIIVNILFGDYLFSILLSLLVNLSYTAAVFPRLDSTERQYFYLSLLIFNLLAVLISIIGCKIKKILNAIQVEKEESKTQLFRLQTLSRIAKEITSELELEKLLYLIVQKTSELMKSNAGGLITLESDNIYRLKAAKGIPKNLIGKEIQLNSGLLGRSLNERKIAVFKINGKIMETASPLDGQYQFLISSPIFSKGDFLGVIFLLSDSPTNPLSKDDRLILETMSEYAAIGIFNANLFKTTANLCVNDYLTGVGNLRYFYQQLEQCLAIADRYQQSCSLMMVDSDCFRKIKHTYGNTQGFMHVKYLAELLKKTIRSSDLIARYDRDTFMIILPQTTLEEAVALGERIKNRVSSSPVNIDGQLITATVSIGIASYPDQAKNLKTLVNAVESALRQAAKLGGNHLLTASVSNDTSDTSTNSSIH